MNRKEFFSRVGFGAAAALLPACVAGLATSCSSAGENTAAPTSVDFILDISTGSLATDGGFLVSNKIVVARVNASTFLAVSAACTHEGTNVNYVNSSNSFHCPVASCFVSALANIGIHRLSHAGNIAPRDETRENARSFASNYKANFLFILVMTADKKLSTLNPNNGTKFYYNDVGDKFMNPSYWEEAVSIRRVPGRTFSSIEIGAFIPDWTIPDAVLQEHQLAMQWLAANGPVFSNGQTFYLLQSRIYAMLKEQT